MSLADWVAEGERRFGADREAWRFVCPVCGFVQTPADYRKAGGEHAEGLIAFSCIGRLMPDPRKAFGGKGPGPCNYAGGGLFGLNPVTVTAPDGKQHHMFAFAEVAAP
jgi:hypothetical protein